MAKNTNQGHRDGSVDNRTQVQNPQNDNFTKRKRDDDSADDGKFMDQKKGGEPFKGVAKERDDRRKNES